MKAYIVVKRKIVLLRERLAIAEDKNEHYTALMLEGGILHLESLYAEFLRTDK